MLFQDLRSALRERFDRLVKTYTDLSEGEFRYTQSSFVLPNRIARLLGLKETRKDRRKRRFGRIRSSIFYYISPTMLILTGLVVYVVVAKSSVISSYFMSGLYLNALIVSMAIFGVLKAYHNGYLMYCAARFVKMLENAIRREDVSDDDIKELFRYLEKRAVLLNTKNMAEAITNLKTYGHPNFNDGTARLIKSKLGFRVMRKNSEVTFVSGILVMLGLLGTFLGLLKTIDAVGQALAGMANMGGGDGGIGAEEMSQFIGSLAAPLQGMGLAFSSSLFGLSGSLFIGFFSHTTGTPQNEFIENFSRWIDDRILKFDAKKAAEGKEVKPPMPDDIKTIMAGFIYQSTQTNRRMGHLLLSMSKAIGEATSATGLLKELSADQQHIRNSVESVSSSAKTLTEQGSDSLAKTDMIMDAIDDVKGAAAKLRVLGDELSVIAPSVLEKLTLSTRLTSELSGTIGEGLELLRRNGEYQALSAKESNEKLMEKLQRLGDDLSAFAPSVLEKLTLSTRQTAELSAAMGESLELLKRGREHQELSAKELNDNLAFIIGALRSVAVLQKDLPAIEEQIMLISRNTSHSLSHMQEASGSQSNLDMQIKEKLEEAVVTLKSIRDKQDEFAAEIRAVGGKINDMENNTGASAIMYQLAGLLEEVSGKNEDIFKKIWDDNFLGSREGNSSKEQE